MFHRYPSVITLHPIAKVIAGIFLMLVGQFSMAQEDWDKEQNILEQLIEEIAAETDEELDYELLYEDFYELRTQPVNLNEATKEDFGKLHILNDFQIYSIIRYRNEHGHLLSPYELRLVPGFSDETVQKILPFVTAQVRREQETISLQNALRYGRHKVFLRSQHVMEDQAGYEPVSDSVLQASPNSYYLGNKYKFYSKYRYHYKQRVYAGITTEKDPGEPFFRKNNKYGFDYYSGYIQINDFGPVKRAVAGDYQLNFGQGLILWSGFGMGKSNYVLNINKNRQGIRRYTSTDENRFFRGASATIGLGNVDITAFYSRKKIDANIEQYDSITGEAYSVSSFQNTGYHFTPNFVFDEDAVTEQIAGGNMAYSKNTFKAGITVYNSQYDVEIDRDLRLYNQFEYFTNNNLYGGIDFQYIFRDVYLFGEAGFDKRWNHAMLAGAILRMHSQISLVSLYRDYSKEYHNLYSSGFAENTSNSNEKGLYLGTEVYPLKKWKISAYVDAFRFPWLRYRVDAPSSGYETFGQIDFSPTRRLSMYWKIKREVKPQNLTVSEVDSIPANRVLIADVKKSSYRYHINYQLNETIELKNRLELSTYKKGREDLSHGYLVYQDIIYRSTAIPFNGYLRFALFDTDDYDARIYAYENDILHAFSIPAFFSKGIRTYLAFRYSFTDEIDFWFKIGHTSYSDRNTIGTGPNEIDGNTRTTIKGQVIISL